MLIKVYCDENIKHLSELLYVYEINTLAIKVLILKE